MLEVRRDRAAEGVAVITKFDVLARLACSAWLLFVSWRVGSVWPATTAAVLAFNAGMCFGHLRTKRGGR